MATHVLSCDWGTSSFRLRLVATVDARILAERRSDEGVRTLAAAHPGDPTGRAAAFRATLTTHVAALLAAAPATPPPALVLISGMAAATIGWHELPYARLPLDLDGSGIVHHELPPLATAGTGQAAPLRVVLLSGATNGHDIMRGEETEALGLLHDPRFAMARAGAVVIMPGTHSKHVQVRAGQLVDLQTFMTGELLAVLSQHSVLQHSVAAPTGAASDDPAADDELCAGAQAAAQTPLTNALFQVRCRDVLAKVPPARNFHYLAGLLIGAELAALAAPEAADTPILLAAGSRPAHSYRVAAEALGLGPRLTVVPPELMDRTATLGQLVCWRQVG